MVYRTNSTLLKDNLSGNLKTYTVSQQGDYTYAWAIQRASPCLLITTYYLLLESREQGLKPNPLSPVLLYSDHDSVAKQ